MTLLSISCKDTDTPKESLEFQAIQSTQDLVYLVQPTLFVIRYFAQCLIDEAKTIRRWTHILRSLSSLCFVLAMFC